MKNLKFIIVIIFGILTNSCNLDEDPIFLDETMYDNPQSAKAALDGIYEKLTIMIQWKDVIGLIMVFQAFLLLTDRVIMLTILIIVI